MMRQQLESWKNHELFVFDTFVHVVHRLCTWCPEYRGKETEACGADSLLSVGICIVMFVILQHKRKKFLDISLLKGYK